MIEAGEWCVFMPTLNIKPPFLTTLSFSGGKQSSCILWMILNGDIKIPKDFAVLTADPGMENSQSYPYVDMMFEKCKEKGIEAYKVAGPSLYEDLTGIIPVNVNHPPYWVMGADGKKNMLKQQCTQEYKIRPIDRKIRQLLHEKLFIRPKSKQLWTGTVDTWIGFSYDEVFRVKPPRQKYMTFHYPLIERRMSDMDVTNYFISHKLPIPPRSVCNACFANGLSTLRDMYYNRPKDWEQAIKVDENVRDLKRCRVQDPVYISNTCLPLSELVKRDFVIGKDKKDQDKWSCDSGYCFA